jgi:hypothetical protein
MALTRAEIELLIKARSDADQAFQKLSGQIKQVTGDAGAASKGLEDVGTKTRGAGTAATATGVAFGLLAERMGRGLVSAFQSTIAAANQLDSGLIGLRSVANAFKQDAGGAEEAAKKLASDGLLSVGAAATSLKNLLAAGFGLPEAVTLVDRFKDSAAFGRQASLDFGQAVSSATEGIKNGNSILVDNAGVTKNLSNILVEAGFSAQDLSKASSDAGIRMALFKGIVKETNPQLGDAARYLETAAGKQAQFSAQVEIAQQKIGKALQPALASTITALVPFATAVGDSAEVLVPLGMAAGAVVAPLVAIRVAAALGIPSITGLGTSMASTLSIFQGVRTFGDARAGIQLVGESAGITTAALGPLGTAAAVAGAAFVGWQLGRAIDQLTGLSGAVERTTVRLFGLSDAAQVAGAKQDVIDRAMRNGAASTITYAQAIEYNNRVEAVRVAGFDKSIEAQRKRIDAELALGRITTEGANAQLANLAAEESAAGVRQRRISFTDALAASEKKFRDEVAATGIGQRELETTLRTNEVAFDAWAKQVNLSDETVKRLKDSIKGKNAALKDSEKSARDSEAAAAKLEAAQKTLRDALESTGGVLTQGGLNDQLQHLDALLKLASTQGSPALGTAVRNLKDEFDKLRQKAIDSGLAVGAIDATFQKAAVSSGVLLQGVRSFGIQAPGFMAPVTEANGELVDQAREAVTAQDNLLAAYGAFGLTAPQDLQRAAQAAATNYEILRSSGTASTEQLKIAYEKMVAAQLAVSGKLPSFWQREIYPSIARTVEQLNTAVQGTFAQMLLGAKGFKDGFVDIWASIKASVTKILADLLGTFVNTFLKGVVGALQGKQGAFSSAFAGIFGGGGTPGSAGGAGLFGSLFGGGAAASNSPAIAAAGLGLPGAGAGAAGGGVGLSAGAAGLLGGLGAGAAGLGGGLLGKQLFGGAGYKAAGFGAGSGAAAGAAIGSVVPGLGTAVGAIIGGLSGLLAGALGKSQGAKTNDVRDKFFAKFGGGGTGDGSGFMTVAGQLAQLSAGQGGGAGGGTLFQNLIKANTLKEIEAAITAVVAGLEKAKTATADVGAETETTSAQATEDYQRSLDVITALEQKATDLSKTIGSVAAEGGDTTELQKQMEQLKQDLAQAHDESLKLASGIDRTTDQEDGVATLSRGFYGLWRDIERAGGAAADLRDTLRDLPGAPAGTGGGALPIEGGAAGGIYANRPGLVLFGEGGQPEVGGPRSFFKDVFADLGVGTKGGAAAGTGGLTVVPLAMFFEGARGFDYAAINRHLASSAGIPGNDYGLREVIEGIALRVVQREKARG